MPILATWLKSDEKPVTGIERRLSHRFQEYWDQMRGHRALPLIGDLNLNDIKEFVPNTFNLDLASDGGEPKFRFVGQEIARDCRQDVTNLGLSELLPQCLLARTLQHREKVISLKKPYIVADSFIDSQGLKTLFRGIMAPFSGTGREVDFIMGAISWKTIDPSDVAQAPAGQTDAGRTTDREANLREIAEAVPPTKESMEETPPNMRRREVPELLADASKPVADWAPAEPAVPAIDKDQDSTITSGGDRGRKGHVIVLGSLKGGTGKSTTAMHLIVSLLSRGHRVGSIDLDSPQATLTRYIENRKALNRRRSLSLSLPDHVTMSERSHDSTLLEDKLGGLAASCDYVVIDTPGSDKTISRAAHFWADTLITPINDSFVDLDILAVTDPESHEIVKRGHYAQMVARARKQKAARSDRGIDWIVLRNRLSNLDARNKQHMADALAKLSVYLGFRNSSGLSERVIYRELFPMGLTLLDLREDGSGVTLSMSHIAARQELRLLCDAIQPQAAAQVGRA